MGEIYLTLCVLAMDVVVGAGRLVGGRARDGSDVVLLLLSAVI